MFLHCPTDGWPAVVNARPSRSRCSDLVGGTPSALYAGDFDFEGRPLGIFVVTAETEQSDLNLPASAITSYLMDHVVGILGPAVIIAADYRDGEPSETSSLPAELAVVFREMGADVLYADRGADHLMALNTSVTVTDDVRAAYANTSRAFVKHLRNLQHEGHFVAKRG